MNAKIKAAIIRSMRRYFPAIKQVVVGIPFLFYLARLAVHLAFRLPGLAGPLNRAIELTMGPRDGYADWIADNEPSSPAQIAAIRTHIRQFRYRPLISVVMPTYNTGEAVLREAITSIIDQLYPHWELCIADDASTTPETWKVLEEFAASDQRIKIVRRQENGNICHASNSALELATGEFVALMDHDDRLPIHALYEVAAEINSYPAVDLIFSDEDHIDDAGGRSSPYFKPGWDQELLLSHNLVSHLGVYRRSILTEIGGFRPGFEGSQDYDLTLRFSERTTSDRIRHIPTVLYHWRRGGEAGSYSERQLRKCAEAAQRAVAEHLERIGVKDALVSIREDILAINKVQRPIPVILPKVSVIIPTRDRADLLTACLTGLLHNTDYSNLEIIIVDNGSVESATHTLFSAITTDKRVKIIRIDSPFNYSLLNNRAAAVATGEILLLLNNDIEVIEPGWLKAMVAQVIRPEVGAVGARLLYPNGRVQHAGIVVGAGRSPTGKGGVANHILQYSGREDPGYFGALLLAREVSAVTGACLAIRSSVFKEVDGFDEEHLGVAFNDIDLCLKIRDRGYKIIWTPLAELYHHEAVSRGPDTDRAKRLRFQREIATMLVRWKDQLACDPYYNPNLSLFRANYQIARYSRRAAPWQPFMPAQDNAAVFVLRASIDHDIEEAILACDRIAASAAQSPILLDASGDPRLVSLLAAKGNPCRCLSTRSPSVREAVRLVLEMSQRATIYAIPQDERELSRAIDELDPDRARVKASIMPSKAPA